jgi:hypothetical protein
LTISHQHSFNIDHLTPAFLQHWPSHTSIPSTLTISHQHFFKLTISHQHSFNIDHLTPAFLQHWPSHTSIPSTLCTINLSCFLWSRVDRQANVSKPNTCLLICLNNLPILACKVVLIDVSLWIRASAKWLKCKCKCKCFLPSSGLRGWLV